VSEIPEHLLRRSRERRAALEGGGGEQTETAKAATVAADVPGSSAPVVASAPAPVAQAAGGGGGAPAGRTPAPAGPAAAPGFRPTRTKLPFWIMPVLVALPLWGFVYMGAFGNRTKNANDPATLGGAVFAANCAACHGAGGGGGVGPQLSGGQVIKTWPKVADHISWVHTGGAPYIGKTYGAQGHTVPASNVMPAFGLDKGGSLTNVQIEQVVCYERTAFGGEPESLAVGGNCAISAS